MLYPDLRHFPLKFFAMYHMNPRKFDHLLSLVGSHFRDTADHNEISNISGTEAHRNFEVSNYVYY